MDDHSIHFHDAPSIQETFRKTAKEWKLDFFHPTTFPSLYSLYNCQTNPRIKFDMARFLILWEQGDIALDINQLPLPYFFHFPQNDFIVDDEDECVWEVSGKGKTLEAHTRFIACDPQHSTLYVTIMRFLSTTNSLTDCADNWCRYTDGGLQRDIDMRTLMSYMANDPARTSNEHSRIPIVPFLSISQ